MLSLIYVSCALAGLQIVEGLRQAELDLKIDLENTGSVNFTNKIFAELGPIGARRYWFYSALYEVYQFLASGPRGYEAKWHTKLFDAKDLTLAHPIHPGDPANKTMGRALDLFKMLEPKMAGSTSTAKTIYLRQTEIDQALASQGNMWGFVKDFKGNQVVVVDGNGRSAALKWASQNHCLKGYNVKIPVETIETLNGGKALSLVMLLTQKLYECTDQGEHMQKLEKFFQSEDAHSLFKSSKKNGGKCGPRKECVEADPETPCKAIAKLESIGSKLDDDADAQGISEVPVKVSDECKWPLFIEQLQRDHKAFTTFYAQRMFPGGATYLIDCVGMSSKACVDEGFDMADIY